MIFFVGILSPADEFQYWHDMAMSGNEEEKERASAFQEMFAPISKDLCAPLSSLGSLQECMELVDTMYDVLDYVWRQGDVRPVYPEARMKHLLEIIGQWTVIVNFLHSVDSFPPLDRKDKKFKWGCEWKSNFQTSAY